MDSIKDRTSSVNKLQGEYLSSSLNQVWTIDITIIKRKYYWFFIMDLASRRIVGYDLANHDYTSKQAIHILEKALLVEATVKPARPVQYIHTDSAGIFLSNEWKQFLEVNEINSSSSDSKTMQNQVSERFNRTFKTILREELNKRLNKTNKKTNTFQLIGEATKYNFDNLKTFTEDVIVYYNTKRPHQHLNYLTPDTWAFEARRLPDHYFTLQKRKQSHTDAVELDSNTSELLINPKPQDNMHPSHLLQTHDIIPFVPLSKNDNSFKAKKIREFKNNIGVLNLRELVSQNKIDVSKFDTSTQKQFQDISQNNQNWERDVKYLETIILQNQVLLFNIEQLQEQTTDLQEQTAELKIQNNELLAMNSYLVEKAQELEQKEILFRERQAKRKSATKLQRRDYIDSNEFFEIVFHILPHFSKEIYIVARTRIACFLMFFTGLRVGNLLVLKVRDLKNLMYDNVGTEIPMQKRGRPNQLISLGEDAQKLLAEDFYDDVSLILKNKEDNQPVFTSEDNIEIPLHRVTHTNCINKALKFASKQFHKNLSAHSFRAIFITEGLMNDVPLQLMQKAMGHKNIKSTEFYNRHDLILKKESR
jgi:transposase InsO family protein/site-specific recombinase XerD